MEHSGTEYVGHKCPLRGVQETGREMGKEESGKRGVTRRKGEEGMERGREGEEKKEERRLRKKPEIKYIQVSKGPLLWDQLTPSSPAPKVHITFQ